MPPALRLAFWLARVLVLDNVRKAIGAHRARMLITGAAPISPDLVRWYLALGLEMVEVWGQTESCGAITANPLRTREAGLDRRADAARAGARFRPRANCSCAARAVFMGYLNQPEKTAETLKDGWLHTGDVGRDGHGRLLLHHRPHEGHHHHRRAARTSPLRRSRTSSSSRPTSPTRW